MKKSAKKCHASNLVSDAHRCLTDTPLSFLHLFDILVNMDNIDSEFEWFNKNREQIIAEHHGEYVAIYNCTVCGYFEDYVCAIDFMEKLGVELGNFMVHPCLTIEEDMNYYYTGAFSFV